MEKRASFRDDDVLGTAGPGFGDPQARGCSSPGSRPRRTGPTAPAGCSPATARATSSSPRCSAPASPTSRRRCRPTTASSCATLYVAAAVRCAPPANKPTPDERDRCLPYLSASSPCSTGCAVVVVLGGFAYEAIGRVLAAAGSPLPMPRPEVRPRARGADGARRGARLLPPVAAEHVHRPAHRAHDRRRLSSGPASWPTGYPRARDRVERCSRLLEGVYVPLITPFAADGSVALDAIERLCHEYLDAGCAGHRRARHHRRVAGARRRRAARRDRRVRRACAPSGARS